MIFDITSSQLAVALNTVSIEQSPWLLTSDLRIAISELKRISSISGDTISLASAPSKTVSNRNFSLSKPVYTNPHNPNNPNNRRYRSSGYQFRSGTIDQEPLQTLSCLLYTSPSPRDS